MSGSKENILDEYDHSNVNKKINIILSNYPCFDEIMNGFEECLTIMIKYEIKGNKSSNTDELGIRIQSSGMSDTTAANALENIVIEDAIHKGTLNDLFKNYECSQELLHKIDVINSMREDYRVLLGLMKTMNVQKDSSFISYVNGNDIQKICDQTNKTYEGVRSSIKRSKKRFHKMATQLFNEKYQIGEKK